jgi:hypothetical protein
MWLFQNWMKNDQAHQELVGNCKREFPIHKEKLKLSAVNSLNISVTKWLPGNAPSVLPLRFG